MNNQEEKIKKLINFSDDAGLAIFDELQEINEGLEEFNKVFAGANLEGIESIQGEKGEQGKDGRDGPMGPKGEKGDKGDPGREGYDGFDGKDGKDGKDGRDGRDGKDGSPDTPDQIKLKLETLKGDARLDASAIKNLPDMVGKIAKDGYPRNLPQPAAAITYQINGQQVGRGNTLNFVGDFITGYSGPDKFTYDLSALTPPIQIVYGTNVFAVATDAGDGTAGGTVQSIGGSVFLGVDTGQNAINADNSVFLGTNAGINATNANNSMFFGTDAGNGATNADHSMFIGSNAGQNASSAYSSVFIGPNSGLNGLNAYQSTFLGRDAGNGATNANDSSFLGYQSGYGATGANSSAFLGNLTGFQATNAAASVFVGPSAGYIATNASNSFFFGGQAGYQATNAANSIFMGYQSGINDTVDNTGGGFSIAIGAITGTGGFTNSIAFGTGAVNTATNQLFIGSVAYPINDTRINGNGGIQVPVGGNADRIAVTGMIRFNTDTSKFEGFDGSVWQDFH